MKNPFWQNGNSRKGEEEAFISSSVKREECWERQHTINPIQQNIKQFSFKIKIRSETAKHGQQRNRMDGNK